MKISEYLKIPYRWVFRRKKTYSQTGEDLIAKFFLSEIKHGFYVDAGANDPVYLNNTYLFYKQGWKGVLVEPDAFRCKILKTVRPRDTVLTMGVGEKDSEMEFYAFKQDTFSTFSKIEAEQYKKLGYEFMQAVKVPVRTLSSIFAGYAQGREIDLLSVDTEGFDYEALSGNDWGRFRPKLVIVEVTQHCGDHGVRQNEKFDVFMAGKGYAKLADTYINSIYVDKAYAARKKLF